MNTNEHKEEGKLEPASKLLTERIIGCAMKVHNSLGAGFLEKVYENALLLELRRHGLFVEQQKVIQIFYEGTCVGDYIADLVVENKVLLELKAISSFKDEHTAICLNYLRATNLPVCLLINFGKPSLQIKRLVGKYYDPQNPI